MKETFVRYSIVLLGALILMLVGGILGSIIGYGHGKRSSAPKEVKTDTIRTTDTIKLPAPPPDTVTKTITKVVQEPLSRHPSSSQSREPLHLCVSVGGT